MSETLDLATRLIARPSVTPDDKGCQQLIAERLSKLGFSIEHLPFGEVHNLWATLGDSGPLLLFAGHTDVVPPGPLNTWSHDPFTPTQSDGLLYGRGSADMKGSLAAMITAAERLLADGPELSGRLGFLITSDEEGAAIDGTRAVVNLLIERGERVDFCVVGEPSCSQTLGDTIRIGRRGSLSCKLVVNGIEGHVAYAQLARNPIHQSLAALEELSSKSWDAGNEAFPPSSFQISNIHAGVGANNVIPGTMEVDFNIRYCTEQTAEGLKQAVNTILESHNLDFECHWHLSGEPFVTKEKGFVDLVAAAIKNNTGVEPERSTGGGTSDGRFITWLGPDIVEFGPCNGSIHKVDEHVRIDDLDRISTIYQDIMEQVLRSA